MIAGYRFLDTLSRTAGSVLWRARRLEDGAPVLLKLLPAGVPPSRFRREFEILRSLDDPGVARPLVLIEESGVVTMILEDFPGESLETVLSRGRPDLSTTLGIGARLADILAGVHGALIVHQDLRPANLLLAPDGRVCLADFSLTTRGGEMPATESRSALPADADPAYISPEQTGRMNRPVDYRTDFYSLGVILYRLLTGRLPFEGGDPLEWVHCHVARRPKPPAEVDAEIPPVVSELVMKLLAKGAEDRYQSAHGLRFDLEHCLGQWRSTGRIVPFPLGTQDVCDRFRIPPKLYGREREKGALFAAFERMAATGWPEVVLVCGYSGIGKSSLVHELHQPVVRRRGRFGAGKFEPGRRDVPYAPLAHALGEVVQQILAGKEEEIALRRGRLQEAMGVSARPMIDLVPQIERLLGPQPPVAELSPAEAQNRLHRLFQRFVGALADEEHPLILFLDDLQWADAGSLGLIEYLITHPDTRHLLLIGACRDGEIGPSHPLPPALERIAGAGVKMQKIALGPLSCEDLGRLIADTLHCETARSLPLARLVHAKTQGNPFFAIQFLTALHWEGLLAFDPEKGGWTWDVPSIEAKGFTDNVLELMVGKLKRFGDRTEQALQLAGCLGNVFELRTLAAVWGRSVEETEKSLEEAVREGLILRRDGTCRFLHDRVHQAACLLLPEEERAQAHLKIGRLLLAHTPPEEVEGRIFDIVAHLNLGEALIPTQEERTRVAELNLRAARRAKEVSAYEAACCYLSAGAGLLGDDPWEKRYEPAFSLYLEKAECEFLNGNFAEAEKLFPVLLHRAGSRIERAAVYRVKIDTQTTRGKDGEAIESALECLRMFNIDLSPHPAGREVQSAYEEVWNNLGDRSVEELVDLPFMADPEMRAAMDILARLYAPAYHSDNNLFFLHLCHGVNISLRHGNSPASVHAYGWFGVMLSTVFSRPRDGPRFVRLALALAERPSFAAYRAKALFVMRIISFWTQPLERMLEHSRAAFEAAVETGDVPLACFSRHHTVMGMLLRGDPLSEVQGEAERSIDFVRRAGFREVEEMIVGIERFVQAMRGRTRHLSTFDDERFSEARFEAGLAGDRMPTLLFYYQVVKLMARFLSGDTGGGLAAGEKSGALLWAGLFSAQGHCFHLYHALTLAAVFDSLSSGRRKEVLAALAGHQEELRRAAETYPPTFRHHHLLVSAEIARIEGGELEAERLYEEAIRSARENGFVQDEGIACELAARFHRGRGLETAADAYLRQACTCYGRWGAEGKVRQIEADYPHLVPPAGEGAGAEPLDLLAVVQASQAISGHIVLDRLLEALMRLVIASAGAQKGALFLLRGEELRLAAEAQAEGEGIDVRLRPEPQEAEANLPVSILNYVRHSRETVLLADAAGPNPFSADEYLVLRRPRSVLCLPIVRQGALNGVLYLENGLAPDVFTPERVSVLELLASQAAVSLENALLYQDLREENAERRRAEEGVRESQRLLQSIIDTSTAVIYVKDLEGRYLLVNRRGEELFHIVPGLTDHAIFPKERADAFRAFDRRVLAARTPLEAEEEALQDDGVHTYISIKAPLCDEAGVPYAVCGISTDITERKRAERHQSAQYAIAGVLAGSATLAEAAPRLLQILCESLGWEMGEVWIVDRPAGLIRPVASWQHPGLNADIFISGSRGTAFAPGEGLPGRVWQSGEPAWVTDVLRETDFRRADLAARSGVHGALAFPILLGRQALGVMAFFSREMRRPDTKLLEILTTIGSQIGQFMERKRAEEELRFSEARYRALHRDNPAMIFTLDSGGTILSVNPFGASQLGYTTDELEGRPVLSVFHENDRPAVTEQLRNCLQNPNQIYRWQFRKIRKDGEMLWVEELAQAVYDLNGILNILVVCQDVTERRRAEEALRREEEKFRYVALATRDAIYDWDIVAERVWRNEAYREIYSREEPIGSDVTWWVVHIHPDDRERVVGSVHEAFRSRSPFWSGEYRLRRFDGSYAEVVDRGHILYDERGEPVRMIGAITDVSDRKKALFEAEAARDRIAALLKSVPDGLIVTDLADRVLLMNQTAEALLGISLAAASCRHIDPLLTEAGLRQQIVEVRLERRETLEMEWERYDAGAGRTLTLQAKTTAVRSARGDLTGTITILRDITREREIDRMKDEFISTAAHELRTPLTTVMGYVELLLESGERFSEEERREFLGLVYRNSEVLSRIVSDLLDLSTVQAGRLITLRKSREDLAPLVEGAVAAHRGLSGRHTFDFEFPDGPTVLCFDPGKVGQVMENLLSNAVKFSPAGGTIRVRGERTDGEFRVTVADEGIGMSPEQVARIFDKFYRADASDTAVGGLGLGMSIVRNIIQAHGGRIWVESEPGRGTRVHFTLPLTDRCPDCQPRGGKVPAP